MTGCLDMAAAEGLIDGRTKIVAAVHASNVLGVINPVAELAALARKAGAVMLVDAAQSVPHMPIDVQSLDCDFLAFSAHKMLGPTGIGVLYGRPELLEAMPPYHAWRRHDHRGHVRGTRAGTTCPTSSRPGTPNIADAVATGAAVDYLTGIGMDRIAAYEHDLTAYAMDRMGEIETIRILGPTDPAARGAVISFIHDTLHPHDLGTALDTMGIAIRTGHHCAMPLVRSYGVVAAARASFYIYNTQQEVDLLVDGIKEAEGYFSHAGVG